MKTDKKDSDSDDDGINDFDEVYGLDGIGASGDKTDPNDGTNVVITTMCEEPVDPEEPVEPPVVDNTLPETPPVVDNTLPEEQPIVDNSLPDTPIVDNSLPEEPIEEVDNGNDNNDTSNIDDGSSTDNVDTGSDKGNQGDEELAYTGGGVPTSVIVGVLVTVIGAILLKRS